MVGIGKLTFNGMDNFRFFLAEYFLATDEIEREIARGTHDPCGWIIWHTIERPCLQRSRECFLQDVFSQAEVFDAENTRQNRHQLSGFVAEEMFD